VPEDKQAKVKASDWMKATLLVVGGTFIEVPPRPTFPFPLHSSRNICGIGIDLAAMPVADVES